MTTIGSHDPDLEKINLRAAIKPFCNPVTAANECSGNAQDKFIFSRSRIVHKKISSPLLVLSWNLLVVRESISATKKSGEVLVRF